MSSNFTYQWHGLGDISRQSYTCGYCGKDVAPNHAYYTEHARGAPASIYICPHCQCPTFFGADKKQTPGVRTGREVGGITDEGVRLLYDEARDCAAAGCHTAAVLVCRKLLMHIATAHGAGEGLKFIEYVDYLRAKGFIPPNGDKWVDKIRTSGNEATHEIRIMV